MRTTGSIPSNRRKEALVALLVFTAVTIILTYPISLHPGTMVNGRPFEDAFESIWYLAWYKQALFDLHVSPLFQPDIFFPFGWDLRFAVLPPLYPILLAPLTALVGAVASYNLTIMATCLVAAYGVYLLSRALGANVWGGILAGIAYAFYPQRVVYFAGHLNFLLATMCLPWLLYALVQASRKKAARWRWMAVAGAALALSIGGAWNFIFINAVLMVAFGLVYLAPAVWRNWKAWVGSLFTAVFVMLLIIGPFLRNALMAREDRGIEAATSFADTNRTSVNLERFLVPSAMNPLVWELSRTTFPLTNGQDGVVTFGYTTLLLAVCGLLFLRPWNTLARALLSTIVVGLVLMPGLMLHVQGEIVSVNLSRTALVRQFLPHLIQPEGSVAIPMPALALYLLFPPFRSFHHFGRWGLLVMVALAPLAGVGVTSIMQRLSTARIRPALLSMGVLLLLLLELNTQPLPAVVTTAEMQRNVDTWLATQPQQSVIIEYPLFYTMKPQSLYYTLAHHQKIVHGSSILPQDMQAILPVLQQWPAGSTLDLLQRLEVRYILVHKFAGDDSFAAETLPALQANERLHLVRHFDESVGPVEAIYLFELAQ